MEKFKRFTSKYYSPKRRVILLSVALALIICAGLAIHFYRGNNLISGKDQQMESNKNELESSEMSVEATDNLPPDGITLSDPSLPSEDEVLEARKIALEGMSSQEIERLTDAIMYVNIGFEHLYMEENLFGVLSDPNALYWNRFHETGEIQIGWAVDGDVDMEAVCQKENLSEQEFYEEYGTPVVMNNQHNADDFIVLIEELREPVQNDALKADLQEIMDLMEYAKNTHVMEYVNSMYKKIHDLDYFLLRYGPTDVGPYVKDDSTITKYYGTLSIFQ